MPILRLQRRRQQPPNDMEKLSRQYNADEPHQRIHLARAIESGSHQVRQRLRCKHKRDDPGHSREHDEIGNCAERVPAALLITSLQILGKDWNEDDRQCSRCEKVI